MLTKADDFPIHQRPEPVASAGTDRNFYDRYFFNGYLAEAAQPGNGPASAASAGESTAASSPAPPFTADSPVYFAVAMGLYPHLNIIDASFSVTFAGTQHNLHASRLLHSERLDTRVGPISVEVVEPLQVLRVRVEPNEHALAADLTFRGRIPPIEEPRFTHRIGPRTLLDYTRMTQNGAWEGWIEVQGRRFDVTQDRWPGTRDRSWGIRPVGAPDAQPVSPPPRPQFYWLWAPLNFPDRSVFFALNEDAEGRPWNSSAMICPDGAPPVPIKESQAELRFKSGTRHAASAKLIFNAPDPQSEPITIELDPRFQFYMSGLGYMNPTWGHGSYKGDNAMGYEAFDLATLNEGSPLFLHVQTFCRATMNEGGQTHEGAGILEQFIIGPHAPSGFKDILDPAP